MLGILKLYSQFLVFLWFLSCLNWIYIDYESYDIFKFIVYKKVKNNSPNGLNIS